MSVGPAAENPARRGPDEMSDVVAVCSFHSPVGWQRLEATDRGLASACFRPSQDEAGPVDPGGHPTLVAAVAQLTDYFAGRRREFSIPYDLSGEPAFRRKVLETLATEVPIGTTVTYGELARMVGNPGAVRAVGGAMNANPVPIFIPCHRVLASSGLGGFAPGLPAKRLLLRHEGVLGVQAELFEPPD